jgi:phosphoribosyl-AMP cyclohydrolase
MKIERELKFDENGLITAIIQDVRTNEVLMVAHMNRDALMKTVESGMTHFWSRSRKKLWLKGESSGHTQTVCGIFVDCDGDALLIKVDQKGGACHTGYHSCFYRTLAPGDAGFEIVGEKVFEPDKVYH